MSKIIAVFGSARVPEDSPEYEEARHVGRALAEAGFTVSTGGYSGVMEAASRGAHEAGGHVIGVTMKELAAYESQVNPYVKEEILFPTLRERLHYLVDHSHGYVAMPGGIGTLQEVAEVWQMLRMNLHEPRPFITYGEFWQPVIKPILASSYIGKDDINLVNFASDITRIVSHIRDWFKEKA